MGVVQRSRRVDPRQKWCHSEGCLVGDNEDEGMGAQSDVDWCQRINLSVDRYELCELLTCDISVCDLLRLIPMATYMVAIDEFVR